MFVKDSASAWQIVSTQKLILITNIEKLHNGYKYGSELHYLD